MPGGALLRHGVGRCTRRAELGDGRAEPVSAEASEAHIRAYLDAFMRSYADRDPAAMRDCFRLPLTFITPTGIRVIESEQAYLPWAQSVYEGLDAQHFGRTDATAISVLELSPVATIAHLDFVRTNTAGEQYLFGAASYVVAKEGNDDWRILTVIGRSR